jgi:dTDP-4-dehydrorhamnose 3,5-epimerase
VRFLQTEINGATLVDPERFVDERGFFARTWCQREFSANGLNSELAQCSISFNRRTGTLRGLHYQKTPFAEAKLIRCTTGSIFDVIVDLRLESPSFLKHFAITLSSDNPLMLYVPEGCAHGFQTLTDNCEVFYQISQFYSANHAAGFRWNDPAFGIDWPLEVSVISERDKCYADFCLEALSD